MEMVVILLIAAVRNIAASMRGKGIRHIHSIKQGKEIYLFSNY